MGKRSAQAEARIEPATNGAVVVPPAAKKHAWFFEHRDGSRYEHLARIEHVNPDGTATLSFQVAGEPKRSIVDNVPPLAAGVIGGGWVAA